LEKNFPKNVARFLLSIDKIVGIKN
jgi:hypothetical protein